ncbi:IGF-like family receptor 1 [Nelusetta ayraudi]|uniref:IGF-like family receptor 1 n=1 Tax=Nelusetta ayraudi TaxID=303726 RepID=UPI003F72A45A
MGYSQRCTNRTTRWHSHTGSCIPCELAPGREVTPNCGFDDRGGQHELTTTPCKNNTYNGGRWFYCKPCSACPPGYASIPCNATTDSRCQGAEVSLRSSSTAVLWALPFSISVSILLAALAFIYVRSRKAAMNSSPVSVVTYATDSPQNSEGFLSPGPRSCSEPTDLLCPLILSAPLQTVLDKLDVLEELVILLDPESHGVKNTKHLASLCSFPSTWITYTYSMRDSKSPLKAVLEGVNSRHPDWTVGHLAEMFRVMERHDAIAVLRKLDVKLLDV